MDDNIKLLLQRLAEDDKTLEALREVLSESIALDKYLDTTQSNELLGAEVKARVRAKELIEEGLKEIKKLKVTERSGQQDQNPGR